MDDHKMYYNKRDLWPILVKSGFLPSNIKMKYHKFRMNLFATVNLNMKDLSNSQQITNKCDNWSSNWTDYAQVATKNPAQWMRHKFLLDQILDLNMKCNLLLDIGSGQGDFLKKAVQSCVALEYVGFEMSEIGVEISQRKVPSALFYQVDLYFPPEIVNIYASKADIVVCSEVIEHVDDPIDFCIRIKDYLRPGGKLLLTVPGGPMSSFDKHIGHRSHFNRSSITKILCAAGFHIDNIMMIGFPFFNLYRLIIILRGKHLISDVQDQSSKIMLSRFVANLVMSCFHFLFLLNLADSPYGWQLVVSASFLSTSDIPIPQPHFS